MTEVSYQEAIVEHRWKKIEKEQNRRKKEASEVEQLNQESDMALKSLDEEMQSLLLNNQSSNNNTDGVMVLRQVKSPPTKELKVINMCYIQLLFAFGILHMIRSMLLVLIYCIFFSSCTVCPSEVIPSRDVGGSSFTTVH